MVGLTLALALAHGGVSVIVVDSQDPAVLTAPAFDGRVSAIASSSCQLFQSLDLWDALAPDAQPINDILVTDGRVRDGASPLLLHFDHRAIGDVPLGNLIENRVLRRVLQEASEAQSNINFIAPMSVRGAVASRADTNVTLADGTSIKARLCVAADGKSSPLREAAGIKSLSWRYAQTGIVATVAHEKPHEGVAQEYFLPSGPFAILPMTGKRSSLVWTERRDLASAFLALDEAGFDAEVARRFGPYLGETKIVGPRWSYPLDLKLALDYVRPRLALAGDAAHVIHPIAGQGFNLGLRDVAALAEVVIDAQRLGEDFGLETVLERYQRWRRFDNVMLAAATDGLNRLFSNDFAPLRLGRDVGLALVNAIPPLKTFFMRHAAGAVGELPRLLRGERL